MEEIFEELKVKFLDALQAALKAFKDTLCGYLKEDVILSARKSLELLKELIKSEEGQVKKAFIADIIMEKVTLPVILKPFRGIIRRILADKIEEAVIGLIEKGQEFIG